MRRFGFWLGTLALVCVCVPASTQAQLVEVINEDFEGVAIGALPVNAQGVLAGDAAVRCADCPKVADDGSDIASAGAFTNNVLILTDGKNSTGAWVWFQDQFDLASQRAEIEFDLFIGRGGSATPADGVSVIFQFDGDLQATGNPGGDLGVGNFRGNQSDYISVGFDIWDNGAADPETPVDGRYGDPSSANVQAYQNNPAPHLNQGFSVATLNGEVVPDFIASADAYGNLAGTDGGTYDADDLVHVKIIFDNRLILVQLEGGISSVDADENALIDDPYPQTTVINTATAEFPDRLSNIGFAASTGGANAIQWIDNLVVRQGPSAVTIEPEAGLTAAGLNCGGPAIDATAEIGVDFRADGPIGAELSRVGDIDTGITITTSSFGRVDGDNAIDYPRPIDVSQIPGAGPITEELFYTNRWDNNSMIQYQAVVVPGRYDVDLYVADSWIGAISASGEGLQITNVTINGELALCGWSSAAAAGSGDGTPGETCTGEYNTAIRRRFSVDVADSGDGTGLLDVQLADLGGGIPPDDPELEALAFNRTGDVTGAPISGDVFDCPEALSCEGEEPVLIDVDFDDDAPGGCPAGMACNTNAFAPQVSADGRLWLLNDAIGSTGNTAIFEETVNVVGHCLTAEFDVFFDNPDAGSIADGVTFFIREGDDTSVVGAAGGALGIPAGTGVLVEFDSYLGGGNDPSGYNNVEAWTHVGINNLSTTSIVTNADFDPNLRPVANGGTGWPNFFDPEGVHVVISYEGGDVTVTLEGLTAELEIFGPTVVAQATVFPLESPTAVVGFSGGTGGATQHAYFDDVIINAAPGEEAPPGPEDLALQLARALWNDGQGELYINCGGPTLICSGSQVPAPEALGLGSTGNQVVWVGDQVGGGLQATSVGEFFDVTPLPNVTLTPNGLNVARGDTGPFDARGTEPGVDDNDRIFHYERYADHQYDIAVPNGTYEVTLWFANAHINTAGTARRFFHLDIEGERLDGFTHCPNVAPGVGLQAPTPNPLDGFDSIYDPVGAGEQLYSADPCNFATCALAGSEEVSDPDGDGIIAREECGEGAATAVRVEVEVVDQSLNIAITEPNIDVIPDGPATFGAAVAPLVGEPASPDANPKISGISVKCIECATGGTGPFKRGDCNDDNQRNITDGVFLLNWLFTGGTVPTCLAACDMDGDGQVPGTPTDALFFFNFQFLGGTRLADPLDTCAVSDRENDETVGCGLYTSCP